MASLRCALAHEGVRGIARSSGIGALRFSAQEFSVQEVRLHRAFALCLDRALVPVEPWIVFDVLVACLRDVDVILDTMGTSSSCGVDGVAKQGELRLSSTHDTTHCRPGVDTNLHRYARDGSNTNDSLLYQFYHGNS